MASTTNWFEKIDKALNRYYTWLGVTDFLNSDGIGKFLQFCLDEELDVDEIEDELEDMDNCQYMDFDSEFPFPPEMSNNDDQTKQQYIFNLIKQCYDNPDINFKSNDGVSQQDEKECTDLKQNDFKYLMDLNHIDDKLEENALKSCKQYAKNLLVLGNSKNKDLCLLIAFGIVYNKPILRFIVDGFDLWRLENQISNRMIDEMITNNQKFRSYIDKMNEINKKRGKIIKFKGDFGDKIKTAVGCEKRIARPILIEPKYLIYDNQLDYIHYVQCVDQLIQKCKEPNSELTRWHLDVMIIPNMVKDKQKKLCQHKIPRDVSIENILKNANIKFIRETYDKQKIGSFGLTEQAIKSSKRTIIIIDKRNNLFDEIYYYQIQGIYGEVNKIAATYLPESNLSNSKEIILPKSAKNDKIDAFTKNPNIFVLSYHMFNRHCVRAYWSPHGNKTRFTHNCVWNIWPNYFASQIRESEKIDKITEWAMNKKNIYSDHDFEEFYSLHIA